MRRKTITITEYARTMDITRDAVYKQIYRDKLPKGVKVIKVAGQNFISIPIAKTVLHFGGESIELK
jgi:hypothetical protein